MAKLILKDINKNFSKSVALKNISIEFEAGKIYSLLGQNGAGKSTLMKIIAGAHSASSGEMLLNGEVYNPDSPKTAHRLGVSMIYQELTIAPHLTVVENIFLGQEIYNFCFVAKKTQKVIAQNILDELGHPELELNKLARSCSIGEKQIIEIARALISGSNLLILDEPTTSLSFDDRQHLFSILRKLKDKNFTILYISHFLDEVFEISDYLYILRDGELVHQNKKSALDTQKVLQYMLGKDIKNEFPKSQRLENKTKLKIKNINSLSSTTIEEGEFSLGIINALAGQLGSGRTEIFESIFALRPRDQAEVVLAKDLIKPTPSHSWKAGLGYLSEDRAVQGLSLDLSISENIFLPLIARKNFISLCKLSKLHEAAITWIDCLKIRCHSPKQKVKELSGGNQQKVAIARLLACNSKFLILDDPTRGIDLGSKADIYQILDEWISKSSEHGILFTSNYLPEILGLADAITTIYRGNIKNKFYTKELTEAKLVEDISNLDSVYKEISNV